MNMASEKYDKMFEKNENGRQSFLENNIKRAKTVEHEGKSTNICEDHSLVSYCQKLKLAVAIAVIRSTPAGMNPESHARSLVVAYTEDVTAWKSKCRVLEEEILSLEQRLQTVELKEKSNFASLGIDIMQDESVEPITTKESFRHPNPEHILEAKINTTIEFVRSFILLGSVSASHYQQEEEKKLKETVLRSIYSLFGHLRSEEGLKMDFKIVKRAVEEVHRIFNSKMNCFDQELVKNCMGFVEDLLVDIHKTLEINKIKEQHRRSILIQMIAAHPSLTTLILCRLLREITIMTDFLESQFRDDIEEFTPLLYIENSYYVFQSTEGLLGIMERQNSSLNVIKISRSLLSEWDKTTEKSLLSVSTHFPMYSLYVWHIKVLLKCVLTTDLTVE